MNNYTEIPFTQYLMPEGIPSSLTISRPPEIVEKAEAIIERGLFFECEMLSDYKTISLTVADRVEEQDLYIELVLNGPDVPLAVDRLVTKAYAGLIGDNCG